MEVIKSPCIKVCRMDGGICIGCGRDKLEISRWAEMSNDEKVIVIEKSEKRLTSYVESFTIAGIKERN